MKKKLLTALDNLIVELREHLDKGRKGFKLDEDIGEREYRERYEKFHSKNYIELHQYNVLISYQADLKNLLK